MLLVKLKAIVPYSYPGIGLRALLAVWATFKTDDMLNFKINSIPVLHLGQRVGCLSVCLNTFKCAQPFSVNLF